MLAAGVQTSVLYPAIHEFTAYAHPDMPSLPQSEEVARRELTLPLFPTLTERDQDRVVAALRRRTGDRPRHQRDCRGGRGRPWRRLT